MKRVVTLKEVIGVGLAMIAVQFAYLYFGDKPLAEVFERSLFAVAGAFVLWISGKKVTS